MARLPYLEAEQSADPRRVAEMYGRVSSWGRPVGHLYRILANQPAALEVFLGMSHYIRDQSSLDPALREIAVLATGHALNQPYELAHHGPVAVAAGVPERTIEAIATGTISGLDPLTHAVVMYAQQAAQRQDVDEEVFEQLRRALSVAQLTDLVVTVAWYQLCAAILGPLRVEVEQEYSAA